ncbi:hypothetical protein B0H14DRAFT_2557631 [Mycena olivaceomarginata]|nr:hypothetical protein B0H14DRAFT_2557631 [Mycena olivaceomarginata]
MPRAPGRLNDASEEEQYFAPPDPRTSGSSTALYGPPQSAPQRQFSGASQSAGQNFHVTQFHVLQRAGQMPPPPFPCSHLARAPTQIDNRPPDYWHSNKHLMCVNRGRKEEYPHSISYRPTTGPCTFGVALLNLEYGRGMVAPNERLNEFMPRSMMKFTHGALLFDWPGYRQESFVLTLVDPQRRYHLTRAALGAQTTQIFKEFINSRKDSDFCDRDGAMRLGIDGVLYDQVRLVELFTKDGMTYRAQFGLNAHFLAVTA